MNRRVQHRDQQLDHLGPHAGQADRKGIRPQQQHRADDLVGQRIAHARGMRPDEVALKCRGLAGIDARVGEVAEAGGDPVDGCPLGDQPLDDRPRCPHPIGGFISECDGPPASCDLDDVVDGEVPAGERKGRHRSLYYAPCDGCRTP